mmetsp:Transcript_84554/g.273870  ORF Transcript_84554/g.273870 Transcript_84554/m.273870 type:complete len:376 (-) Transcript_84554:23-1150(-)
MDGRAPAPQELKTPRPGWLHIIKYDHFTQTEQLKASLVEAATEAIAMYDEADSLFGPSQRGKFCSGVAPLFLAVVWATATALRKFSDNIVPLQRVAANFSLHVPITNENLIVFYTHLLYFRRPVDIQQERKEETIEPELSAAYRAAVRDGQWHQAATEVFHSSARQLMEVAARERPALLFVESAPQAEHLLSAARAGAAPAAAGRIGGRQEAERGEALDVCVLPKSVNRAYNWGRRFRAIVSLPLMMSVAGRVQMEGRILRLDQQFKQVRFVTVVPRYTILESLRRRQLLDDAWQVAIEQCGAQALRLIEERDRRGQPGARAEADASEGRKRPSSSRSSSPASPKRRRQRQKAPGKAAPGSPPTPSAGPPGSLRR